MKISMTSMISWYLEQLHVTQWRSDMREHTKHTTQNIHAQDKVRTWAQ